MLWRVWRRVEALPRKLHLFSQRKMCTERQGLHGLPLKPLPGPLKEPRSKSPRPMNLQALCLPPCLRAEKTRAVEYGEEPVVVAGSEE